MRIALVTEFYYPHLGGICEHVHYFAREARRSGHHVDIITSNIAGAAADPNVIRIGHSRSIYFNGAHARLTFGTGLRAQLKQTLRQGRYDVVHVHSPLNPSLPLMAIDAADCAVVGTFHTYFEKSHLFALARRPLQERLDRMAAAIAVSPSTTRALSRYFEADWKIIPNGVDLEVFNPGAPRPAGIPPRVPVVLFVGRFDPRNGLATLLEAHRTVSRRGCQAQLVIVGDGPLRRYYRTLAGGQPGVIFVGPVLEGRAGYYAHAAAYACPTTKASFGITLLESMACATPVVCSDIAGFRDVVSHRHEALMFPCGDANALAESLIRALDEPGLATRLGQAGRVTASRYAWPGIAAQILDVYRAVLGVKAAA